MPTTKRTTTKAAKPKAPVRVTKGDLAIALQEALVAMMASHMEGKLDPVRRYVQGTAFAKATLMAKQAAPAQAKTEAETPATTAAPTPEATQAKTYRIYTDGSCLANGTPRAKGGWAYLVVDNEEVTHRDSGGARGEAATNNAMELLAIQKALEHTEPGSHVVVATDSQVAIGWLFMGWQCHVEHNQRLVGRIKALMADRRVRHEKVKGHSAERFNTEVDGMAVAAARAQA